MESVWKFLNDFHVLTVTYALFLLVLGYFVARFLSAIVSKQLKKQTSPHSAMLLQRSLFYLIFILFFASAIQQLGFHIGTLLGAAGILTAAIGFASQTSMSNVISGIFIIGEKPFAIGDTIKVDSVQGEVTSIDLLSVKIRTSDNMMIRIPNEVLIKTAITNLSFFPDRRADLKFNLFFQENIPKIRELFLQVATKNPLCLKTPVPQFQLLELTNTLMSVQLSVWATQANFGEMKNSIMEELQLVLVQNNVNLTSPVQVIRLEKSDEA